MGKMRGERPKGFLGTFSYLPLTKSKSRGNVSSVIFLKPFSSFSTTMSSSSLIHITAGPYRFLARFENAAPLTVAKFLTLLPYRQKLIHVRWSGEGLWIPLGETDWGVPYENHTSHPSTGQILLYPGGISETEILCCYGGVSFASKMGPLAANHFLTITDGLEMLRPLGERVLWQGAQDVTFEIASEAQ